MTLEEDFTLAVELITKGPRQGKADAVNLSNEQKLKFYGLYKQSTEGKCTQTAPSRLSIMARAKWSAWNELGNITKEAAMKRYIAEVAKVQPRWQQLMKPQAKSKL